MTDLSLPIPRAGPQRDTLPHGLQEVTRFLPWREVPKRGGFRKMPLGSIAGIWQAVNSADSIHHLTLKDAIDVVHAGQATGIGVHIDHTLGLLAIDLDHCVNTDDVLSERALATLATFPGTYAERSASGFGIHLLIPGVCPPGWRRQSGMEVLDAGFVTVTGHVIRPEDDSSDRSDRLAAWHASWAPTRRCGAARPTRPEQPAARWSASTAALFAELEAGRAAHYPSASEADLAYVLLLLRREPTLSDADLLAHVRASGRMRPKWLQPSYMHATLNAARQIRARSSS